MSTRAAVLGTGSWGTAFAATMADSGSSVVMWGRRQEVVDQVNAGSNTAYLPGVELPEGMRATVDAAEAPSSVVAAGQGSVGRRHWPRLVTRRCSGRLAPRCHGTTPHAPRRSIPGKTV